VPVSPRTRIGVAADWEMATLGVPLAAGCARRTGRDISRIGCYVAFGYFKLAVVLEGIYARYPLHHTVGDGIEHEGLAVPTLVARAHQVLGADD
jgi:aminoglycoside phosphotransferase (APT) family kinase protein